MAIDFPMTTDEARPRQEVEVTNIYKAMNPQYGPNGSNGLWLTLHNLNNNNDRNAFFPDPPSSKTTALIAALEKLGIGPSTLPDGWDSLIGYKFAWTTEQRTRPMRMRDDKGNWLSNSDGTPRLEDRTFNVEYPIQILGKPGKKITASASDNGGSASEETLTDLLVKLADGKTLDEIKFAARNTPEISSAPTAFKRSIGNGSLTDKLVEEGRLEVEGDVFRAVL